MTPPPRSEPGRESVAAIAGWRRKLFLKASLSRRKKLSKTG